MQLPDLNLLVALDALLDEGSVVGAARRMNLSPAAMSRTLTRIREAVGDPILVRAGRGLVATPRALALHGQVRQLVEQASHIFNGGERIDLPSLERVFSLRAHDAFIVSFSALLLQTLREQAPLVTLRFLPEGESADDDEALRDGRLDLYIGAARDLGPEVKVQGLFATRLVCLARQGHPLFEEQITVERFAAHHHVNFSRHGLARGPIDAALADLGLERRLTLITPNFYAALYALLESDLLLPVPEHMLIGLERLKLPLRMFQLPVSIEPVKVMQAWHPRFDNDAAHRWLREVIKACCTEHQL